MLAGGVGQIYGPLSRQTLIYPDRDDFSPRVGFAWRAAKNTVVRGGYGVNFANGQYISFIQDLAFQPPFADVQTNQATQPTAGLSSVPRFFLLAYLPAERIWNAAGGGQLLGE